MKWLTIFSVPLVAACVYYYIVGFARSRFPKLRNKRICLLIAHPDDEAMFFAPTVVALTDPALGNHVKILCLSSGDADGLGETRKRELVKSGVSLGLRHEDDVFIVESPDFPDSMTTTWDKHKIANLLSSAFAPIPAKSTTKANPNSNPNSKQCSSPATIDVLITFDEGGISNHPNHISLFHGARAFIASVTQNSSNSDTKHCPVDMYTLTTLSILRKYSSFVDALVSFIQFAISQRGDLRASRTASRGTSTNTGTTAAITRDGQEEQAISPRRLLFVSGGEEVRTAQRAMTTAHKSQMHWFRWGWIVLSRYMVVNDLRREEVLATT